MRVLHGLGATVDVYGRKLEKLFREKMPEYDVIINCVLWDISRTDHLIYKEDLKRLKPHTMIIDVSCDPHLGIETSHPTTISDPIYTEDGVIHYAVDNTPAMFPMGLTSAELISKMKPTAVFISVSRLDTIDARALFEKARENPGFYVCLDLDVNPQVVKQIPDQPNVLVTPHIAGGTVETRKRMFAEIAQAVAAAASKG